MHKRGHPASPGNLEQGRLEQAEHAFRRAIALTRACDDRTGEAFTQLGLAETLVSQGNGDHAEALLHDLVHTAQRLGHQFLRARSLLALGHLTASRGNHVAAASDLAGRAAIFERCGIPPWQARALESLAAARAAGGREADR